MSSGFSGTLLLTGASGQVGSELMKHIGVEAPEASVVAPARAALDLARPDSIRAAMRSVRPRWVVSCGAYTAVDAAESDRDMAFALNATAPGVLAEEAAVIGATLIHLSTDYVFDGSGSRPWTETDGTGPLNVYGASKLAGEHAIAVVAERTGLQYFILRTSWVYSSAGKNFVRTMLRLLSTRAEPLRIVADQHGAPTAAADVASAVLDVIRSVAQASPADVSTLYSGMYHCAGGGETTWFGLASAVREYLRMVGTIDLQDILPVRTADYPASASRPLNSRMNTSKLAQTFGIRLPHWSMSLPHVLHELRVKESR